MKSIKKDPLNSLVEAYKKDDIDYYYEQALKYNNNLLNASLALRTMSNTDLEILLLKLKGVI